MSVITVCVAAVGLLVAPAAGQARPAAPTILTTHKLIGSDTARHDLFGAGIAVSGQTVVVGASGANDAFGAAYVFIRTSSGWSQQAKLTGGGQTSQARFGGSVAIEGDTIVVGAEAWENGEGAVYLYQRTGTTWSQSGELTSPGFIAHAQFGDSVAIRAGTIVVGAPGVDGGEGAAYVYQPNAVGQWVLDKTLTASDAAAGSLFGASVAIGKGTVAVGALGAASEEGRVYTFASRSWSQHQELSDPYQPAANTQFGSVVAFDHAGHTLVASSTEPAAYVYHRVGGAWQNEARLVPADAVTTDGFIAGLAVSATEILIGAPNAQASSGGPRTGIVYPFADDSGTWDAQPEVTDPGDVAGDEFGAAVGLMGKTALVGSVGNKRFRGIAYRFTGEPF